MKLTGVSGSCWVDFGWISALTDKADPRLIRATAALEEGLEGLWGENVWAPGQSGGSGLVFPVDRNSLRRVHDEPGQVHVGYAVCEGVLAAAVILHVDKAIGPYAQQTIAWARERFNTERVAFVRSLCVRKRGYGIGREMLVQTRRRARFLEASAVVSHLRVQPETDPRLAKAYADAGFTTTGEEQTTTIRQTITHQWAAMCGRETPVDLAWLPGSTEVELHYVPVAASTARTGSRAESRSALTAQA